jgi:putative ABC transport system permease protein
MKYFHLLVASLFRRKIRTLLTTLSFLVALFLFGLLVVVHGAFNQGLDIAGADRLVIINKVSIIQPLPVSYQERLLRIPGVKEVTHQNWFGGVYQDERNFFPQMANDDETFRSVFNEFKISDDEWHNYMADREGAIVGQDLIRRYHWKIGDRIPLKGTIFTGAWEFNIRGVYHGTREQDDNTQFWFHYKYLEERENAYWKGLVGWYTVKVNNPDDSVRIAKQIDEMFANSPWETKTDTEKSFAASWVKQAGNISFLMMSIGGVVFFTLLLVTGNTMAIAVRERMRELAVLKAVGFTDGFVLLLVLAESLLVAALGGALGVLLAKAFTLGGDPTRGLLPFFYLPLPAMVVGLGLALAVGMAAGILPAISAMRLNVVTAMRKV